MLSKWLLLLHLSHDDQFDIAIQKQLHSRIFFGINKPFILHNILVLKLYFYQNIP